MPSLGSQLNNNAKSTCKSVDIMSLRDGLYTYVPTPHPIHTQPTGLKHTNSASSFSAAVTDERRASCAECAARLESTSDSHTQDTVHNGHVDNNHTLDTQLAVDAFRRLLGVVVSPGIRGASTVAIDNKIEQAMDLVKSHLMFAVREEVLVLKEQIKELLEKNSQLEYENNVLRAGATPETLAKLSQATSTGSTQTSAS